MWKPTSQSITAEPQTTVDDGGNTFEFVCGRETNHLHPPSVPVAKKGVSPSSDHNLRLNPDNAPQDKSTERHEQQGDSGFVSQRSCSTALDREGPSEGYVQAVSECTINSCTADDRSELVPGCRALLRVDRSPVGMRAVPLPRSLLPVVQELAAEEGGVSAGSAVQK